MHIPACIQVCKQCEQDLQLALIHKSPTAISELHGSAPDEYLAFYINLKCSKIQKVI